MLLFRAWFKIPSHLGSLLRIAWVCVSILTVPFFTCVPSLIFQRRTRDSLASCPSELL